MSLLLGLLIFSFTLTSVLLIPFINLLYFLRFQRQHQVTKDAFGKLTPIFDHFHRLKAGTPIGGGFLIILVVSVLFGLLFPLLRFLGVYITQIHPLNQELNIIFFAFISFGLLGLYDDILKFFGIKKSQFFGLRMRHKFFIQWVLALILSVMLYLNLGISIINVPIFGVLHLGVWYIPFAAFVIVSFANAVNITDGLDGLAAGVLMICLFAFWFLSASILDTPLSIFVALWLGAIIAFLYFNTHPARIFLGDVGALSFGATLAVVGLLLGKVLALVVIGGIFTLELVSSLLQLLSKRVLKRKIFPVSPFHLWLQYSGWEETKIVFRAYLAAIMLALFGLWLAMM